MRILIDLIDVFVAALASITATTLIYFATGDTPFFEGVVVIVWTLVWFLYFVLLKHSRFRSVGYVVARAQIVDLYGERPSIWTLFVRFLFTVLGPLNLAFDLFWIPSDPARQALRDKFAGTYVVHRGAVPAGTGPIKFVPYSIFGGSFIFREVKVPEPGAP